MANLHCSLIGIRAAQGRGREEEPRSAHPVHSFAPPASRICVVGRATQISRALAGVLPLAPPPSLRGSSQLSSPPIRQEPQGRSSWIRVVRSTLRGMRPIFRLPGLQLPSLAGRRPRQGRYPRPRGSLRSPCSESADADAVPAAGPGLALPPPPPPPHAAEVLRAVGGG